MKQLPAIAEPIGESFGRRPLTPTLFLERAAAIAADDVAVVHDGTTWTYGEFSDRCSRLAGALVALGIRPGDTVSILAPNVPIALEATFGVPWAGAVLNSLNFRLAPEELGYILRHAETKVLIADATLSDLGRHALDTADSGCRMVTSGGDGDELGALIAHASPLSLQPSDELSLLSLNYTSGTTGRPKGVMYSHRGAYLQSLAMMAHTGLKSGSSFLWTLPMFHCNGWCFPWAVTAAAATHVCLPRVEPAAIWRAVRDHGITHLNAAPTVLNDLSHAPDAAPAERSVRVATGGAPPSPTLLARLADLNFDVTHLYGLTETYGPAVICLPKPGWRNLKGEHLSQVRARQGVPNVVGEALRIVDGLGLALPHDGVSAGEVQLRGNNVMLGYFRDPDGTAAASHDGWFRTGDIGVVHPDGYLELRDRVKDVIISGGENITSIEVEQVLLSHPAVLECAVVSAPDERWGEVPVAFVAVSPDYSTNEQDLILHVKSRIARFKAPHRVYFEELPKTATGKVQKYALRDRMWKD